MMDCVSRKIVYSMVEDVDDTATYENHPYEEKGGW
jgi:hypothetical protein